MSVLIKGMEMPDSCSVCLLVSRHNCGTFCRALKAWIDDDGEVPRDRRRDDCPLVEVPTPHGRLIEGDKLLDMIWRGEVYSGDAFERRIKSTATIVPAEED
jgi:hypothetical protein